MIIEIIYNVKSNNLKRLLKSQCNTSLRRVALLISNLNSRNQDEIAETTFQEYQAPLCVMQDVILNNFMN